MNTICFGQQPAGFFPKRFLVAKINTARALQREIGGRIVFFYHDSDADYRETITIMNDRQTGAEVRLNFTQENKLQKKFSPLYLKRIPGGWKEEILKQLPRFITPTPCTSRLTPVQGRLTLPQREREEVRETPQRERETAALPSPHGRGVGGEGLNLTDIFKSVDQKFVADFCLEVYQKMGLLDGIEVLRSSDKSFREQAPDLAGEFFADVEYGGEIVRAKIGSSITPTAPSPFGRRPSLAGGEAPRSSPPFQGGVPERSEGEVAGVLHEGGNQFIRFPINQPIQKSQKSPGRDQRFAWMQSVINCTHYIYGEGEKEYLDVKPHPNIKFIDREKIDNSNFAFIN